jgi:kynurenine formamidase
VKLPILVLAAVLTKGDIDKWMESLSNWGRWGKEDELGALNLITPQKRRQAAALVREGFSVSLAHDAIKEKADDSPAFGHSMIEHGEQPKATGAADIFSVQYHGFTATHLDALCHIFYRGRMYNGFPQKNVTAEGARKLSVNRIRNGIFTRAVLMDLSRHLGARYLEGNRSITVEDLEAWEKRAAVKVGPGDALLIRTGRWARRAAEGTWDIMKNSAGIHASSLPWLRKRDVAIVGSDLATDVMPSGI